MCTIGHALWVHNLGLYQAHYAKLEATTADLIQLCSGQNHTDEFDIDSAIADASLSYQRASKGLLHHPNDRRLVWWQQLCEPPSTPRGAHQVPGDCLPQLMCFAETCQVKKAAEQTSFEVLVNAHNKFEMAFAEYRDEVVAYNDGVEKKHLFSPPPSPPSSPSTSSRRSSTWGTKTTWTLRRFDSGADNGHCGLTDCQVQVCGAQLKSHFETFVSTDTCTPAPYSVDKICNPPPSPLPVPAPVVVAEVVGEVKDMETPVLPGRRRRRRREKAGASPCLTLRGPTEVKQGMVKRKTLKGTGGIHRA